MKYGVVLPIWQLTIAEAESLTLRAETLGLDGVFVPDHILAKPATTQHYGGHWPDPFSLLAFLAGRTHRIHLGASVIVLPYRNALVAAKAAATVDQASGGRFIFGVGVGWDEAEFDDLRLAFRERGRLSDDYLRAIKAAWASDVPEYRGGYVSFGGATFSPRPAQRPHPPIWVGGAPGGVSAPAVRRAAELGDAWHPLGLGLDAIEKGYATVRDLATQHGRRGRPGLAPRNLLDLTDAAKGSGRAAFQGSVDEVAADVRRVRSLGAEWMTFDLPRAGVPAMLRAMERLAGEVKPAAA
jgi:probable F420-dependent oxidoreductase